MCAHLQDEGTLEEIGSGHDDMTEMLSGRQAVRL